MNITGDRLTLELGFGTTSRSTPARLLEPAYTNNCPLGGTTATDHLYGFSPQRVQLRVSPVSPGQF